MELRLYNTITRSKDVFTPIDKKLVRMYTCGPTVYNYAHIGNLRTYIFEDILKRVLLYNSFRVKHVMNITDVGHLTSDADTGEDKMENGAKREKKTVWEIAEFYTKAFRDDLKRLNIIEPDIWCRATEHIKQQIEQIRILEKKGFTYRIEDGIYFDTSRLNDYGKLARLDKEGLMAGARIEMVKGKKHPTDFALWKFSPKDKKRQMEWESPWGTGFPGWHIECSAMSMHYLGESFDIHCGGIDHIPVHHTNEIAQAEASTGKEWVRFWLHGEFLVLDQAKMAKSGENFITLNTLVEKGYEPLDYRYLCLTAHYRQQLGFSWAGLDTARNSLNSLKNKIIDILDEKQSKPDRSIEENHKKQFLEAINDDLNMPRALAVLWETVHDDKIGSWDRFNLILDFDRVFGLRLDEVKRVEEIPGEVKELLEQRERARTNKDWKTADGLRKRINAKGYLIDDTANGAKLKKG